MRAKDKATKKNERHYCKCERNTEEFTKYSHRAKRRTLMGTPALARMERLLQAVEHVGQHCAGNLGSCLQGYQQNKSPDDHT